MTELAVPEQQAVATQGGNAPAPVEQINTKSALVIWAEEARVVANIAVSIAKTPFAGQLRGKPEEVTAVILAGNELGFKPMAALKAFDIIQGTPAMRAHAMRGLVMSHGHKVKLVESDAQHCVMRGRRAGDEDWQEVSWDMPRAALLGLTNKAEWKKQPQTMLIARATGEICRLIAADALHGVPYTSEELTDSAPMQVTQIQAAPLSLAALTATPAPAPAAAPVVESEVIDPVADDAEHAAAVADLHAFGTEMGATDIEQDAYGELGVPVEDATAQDIRNLVNRWRNAAA
jgi:hypothetical protein